MTLTQRLTRAGATFIIFGVAAALVPTNGNAYSATDTCTVLTQKDYVGQNSTDASPSYTLTSNTLTLTAFPANGVTALSVSSGETGFTNTLSGNSVTTTRNSGTGPETVIVTFSDNHTVTYTVS